MSLRLIPSCPLVTMYEYFLLGMGPLFTILEGIAAMECILEIDPVYGESISELNNVGKVMARYLIVVGVLVIDLSVCTCNCFWSDWMGHSRTPDSGYSHCILCRIRCGGVHPDVSPHLCYTCQ